MDVAYEDLFRRIQLSPGLFELQEMILQDENVISARKEYQVELKTILADMEKYQYSILKARKLLITEKIDSDDLSELKKEYKQAIGCRNNRLAHVSQKLISLNFQTGHGISPTNFDFLQCYKNQDIAGKRYIISLLTPTSIDSFHKSLGPLKIDDSITKIVRLN